MDAMRLMLLSLLIGAQVSTGTPAAGGVVQAPVAQVAQQGAYMEKSAETAHKVAAAYAVTINTGTTITRELYHGTKGSDVRLLQQLLRDLGYAVTPDGIFGSQTRNAVVAFQKNNGLSADGIAGVRTIRKMVSGDAVRGDQGTKSRTTLSYGMTGQDVKDLQTRLRQLGYYMDVLSGNYLTNTRNAVRWFQQLNGLSIDGIAGPMTLSRLYSAAAIPAGTGTNPTPAPTATAFYRSLYKGLSGNDVQYLQKLLKDLGYFGTTPTGYFGSETEWAVRTFQAYNNLYPDGIAGNTTFTRLLSGKAIPYPGTGPAVTPTPSPTPAPTATSGGGIIIDTDTGTGTIITPDGGNGSGNTGGGGIIITPPSGSGSGAQDSGGGNPDPGNGGGTGGGGIIITGP